MTNLHKAYRSGIFATSSVTITTLKDKTQKIIGLEGGCGDHLGQSPLKAGVDPAVLGKAPQITSSREWT